MSPLIKAAGGSELVWGYSQTGWTAISAVGTASVALLTLATTLFIAVQVLHAREAFVAGVVERANARFSAMRGRLFNLNVASKTKPTFSNADLKALRNLALGYAYFASSVQFVFEKRTKSATAMVDQYVDDLDSMIQIIRRTQKDIGSKIEAFGAQSWQFQERMLADVSAEPADIAAIKAAFDAKDFDKAIALHDAVIIKRMATENATAEEIVEKVEKKEAQIVRGGILTRENLEKSGIDYDNMVVAELWLKTLDECLDFLQECTGTVRSFIKRARRNALIRWIPTNAHR